MQQWIQISSCLIYVKCDKTCSTLGHTTEGKITSVCKEEVYVAMFFADMIRNGL